MSEIVIRIPLNALRALLAESLDREEHGSNPNPNDNGTTAVGGAPTDERPWTDSQKRMVYRLVHQLGYEGEAARNFITATLRLPSGQTPGIKEASRLIDSLKEQLGPNGRGARHEAS